MNQEIFALRRKAFLERLRPGSMAILFAAPHAKRNDDVHYEYRTCSYFYYLTGVREQEAAAIFLRDSDKPYRLFLMPKNPEMEMWEGKRVGVDDGKRVFQADATFPIAELEKEFREQLKQADTLYHVLGNHSEQDDLVFRVLKEHKPNPRRGERKFLRLERAQEVLNPMRKVKAAAELDLIRKNCRNSAIAHRKAMELTKPGQFEYQVEAEIEFWFRYGGADDLAYASIVAGGNNATVLHYKTNREQFKDGDLLLIDAGGEMDLYASDITRTYPVNGKFSKPQKELYEIVLKAQKAAIAAVKPGVRFADIHKLTVDVLVEGLLKLGLLKGKLEEIVKDRKNYGSFYPHNTSHWLGMDVHDCGDYFLPDQSSIPLEVGNILTIEPGLYISSDRTDVPAEYRGIGIRIEDDVLVTASGSEVMTSEAPKEIAEIEAIVGTGKAR
ncbi:MAG TPA: aminopeptidase P N-terminal domain-containing protein [Bdellovibrionota bacterium]|jgi:Xaa-Pro aminopeptidase